MFKLIVGAGRHRIPGWLPIDKIDYGDNIIFDLDSLSKSKKCMAFEDNSVDEMIMTHVLEHIGDTLGLMEELHRVATPGCKLQIAVPFAFSEADIEDQTHVRHFTFNSFCFFSQPVYCNADYGYRGDWHCEEVQAICSRPTTVDEIKEKRNICSELITTLVAVKPIRKQKLESVTVPRVTIVVR